MLSPKLETSSVNQVFLRYIFSQEFLLIPVILSTKRILRYSETLI